MIRNTAAEPALLIWLLPSSRSVDWNRARLLFFLAVHVFLYFFREMSDGNICVEIQSCGPNMKNVRYEALLGSTLLHSLIETIQRELMDFYRLNYRSTTIMCPVQIFNFSTSASAQSKLFSRLHKASLSFNGLLICSTIEEFSRYTIQYLIKYLRYLPPYTVKVRGQHYTS